MLSYLPNTAATQTHLDSAGLFTVLAVTLWTTTLIAYRIYSVSNNVLNREKPRLYRILELITQSSFIYSLALVADAVLGTIPLKQSNVWKLSMVSSYVGVIVSAITVCQCRYYCYITLFVIRCLGNCTYLHGGSSCSRIKDFLGFQTDGSQYLSNSAWRGRHYYEHR